MTIEMTKDDSAFRNNETMARRLTRHAMNSRIAKRPMLPKLAIASLSREYLRSLRAAEMAAWEMTGGDFMLARFATNGVTR
jgi:hypothetical protein